MTKLRKKMLEDMQLNGLSKSTQKNYIMCVKKLSQYFKVSPDCLLENDIRRFFLYLINEVKISRSTLTMYLCGIRFFYKNTLGREWEEFKIIKPRSKKKLPVILSVSEVKSILDKVKNPSHRMCLTLIYSCGLRISEGAKISVYDIDRNRMILRIKNGKRGKDRYVPLSQKTYIELKKFWKKYKPFPYLFKSRQNQIVSRSTLHLAFKLALKESGITKEASVHSLRHSYATHLMESGISTRAIQIILGHTSPRTTTIYTHWTGIVEIQTKTAIENLVNQI